MTTDVRALHRRALSDADALVGRIGPNDLPRPTPCGDWSLADLLNHMVGQHYGFAAAVESGDAPLSDYAGPGDSALAGWPASVERIETAFAGADLQTRVRLIEISPELSFPAEVAIGFQLLDTVVHAWDVATSLDLEYRPDDELLQATLASARRVPGGEARTKSGAAFGPELSPSQDDPWLETLALLGRQPH